MRKLKITKQITRRNDASINRYFNEVNKYPLVIPEEEVELSVRIKKGDADALEKLVQGNLRFVISVAKQYQNQGLAFSDLINEGNLGLVKAAKKFDETRGFKFISYAVWWIRQAIIQAISEQTRIVRLPLNRLSSINKINRAIPFLEQEFEREPTNHEIASFLDIPGEEVEVANKIKKRQVSFDHPISSGENDDFNLYDLIPSENLPAPDRNLMQESMTTNVSRALGELNKREAAILTMAFGLQDSPVYSLNDIAGKYQMSAERVRQIKQQGLIKLKTLIKENKAFLEY